MNNIMYKMPDINSIRNNRVYMGLVTIGSNALDVTTGFMYKDPDRGICIEGNNLHGKGTVIWTDRKRFKLKMDDGREYIGVMS